MMPAVRMKKKLYFNMFSTLSYITFSTLTTHLGIEKLIVEDLIVQYCPILARYEGVHAVQNLSC